MAVTAGVESFLGRGHRSGRLSKSGSEGGVPPGSRGEPAATRLLPRQAVAQILPFRHQNRQALDGLWSRHHVERVEIVMKETVDAEGAWKVPLSPPCPPCVCWLTPPPPAPCRGCGCRGVAR